MRAVALCATRIFTVFSATWIAGCCLYSTPRHDGPPSDHFDGRGRFFNPWGDESHADPLDLARWQVNRDRTPWPERPDAPPGAKPPPRVARGELRVTFVNHATTLIQIDGLNILTDPVWSKRVGPTSFAGITRKRPPGIRFEDLPRIDAVLVSHNHYDHLDLPTLERLSREHSPRVFVGLGIETWLEGQGVERVSEADWWDSFPLSERVLLHYVPAKHFSMRGACDRDGTLWTGYVLETKSGGSVYFAGDTGFAPHFGWIGRRFAPIRLALLPIGSYRPRWFMKGVHISPEEAVAAHEALGAENSVAIHFGTFQQADDGEMEPVRDLYAALSKLPTTRRRFWALAHGEGRVIPAVPARLPVRRRSGSRPTL